MLLDHGSTKGAKKSIIEFFALLIVQVSFKKVFSFELNDIYNASRLQTATERRIFWHESACQSNTRSFIFKMVKQHKTIHTELNQ
jgi:hypothetical protein